LYHGELCFQTIRRDTAERIYIPKILPALTLLLIMKWSLHFILKAIDYKVTFKDLLYNS